MEICLSPSPLLSYCFCYRLPDACGEYLLEGGPARDLGLGTLFFIIISLFFLVCLFWFRVSRVVFYFIIIAVPGESNSRSLFLLFHSFNSNSDTQSAIRKPEKTALVQNLISSHLSHHHHHHHHLISSTTPAVATHTNKIKKYACLNLHLQRPRSCRLRLRLRPQPQRNLLAEHRKRNTRLSLDLQHRHPSLSRLVRVPGQDCRVHARVHCRPDHGAAGCDSFVQTVVCVDRWPAAAAAGRWARRHLVSHTSVVVCGLVVCSVFEAVSDAECVQAGVDGILDHDNSPPDLDGLGRAGRVDAR